MYETERNWKDGVCCTLTARFSGVRFLAPLISVFSSQVLKSDFTVLLTSEVKEEKVWWREVQEGEYIHIQLIHFV